MVINFEINLTLSWSTDAKLYVLVATLPANGNEKLLKKLKSGFKRTI